MCVRKSQTILLSTFGGKGHEEQEIQARIAKGNSSKALMKPRKMKQRFYIDHKAYNHLCICNLGAKLNGRRHIEQVRKNE